MRSSLLLCLVLTACTDDPFGDAPQTLQRPSNRVLTPQTPAPADLLMRGRQDRSPEQGARRLDDRPLFKLVGTDDTLYGLSEYSTPVALSLEQSAPLTEVTEWPCDRPVSASHQESVGLVVACCFADGLQLFKVGRGSGSTKASSFGPVSPPVPRCGEKPQRIQLVANDELAVVAHGSELLLLHRNHWRRIKLSVAREYGQEGPTQLEVGASEAWIGFNAGEWGGSLVHVDLAKGTAAEEFPDGTEQPKGGPVGLVLDAQGSLAVALGTEHLSLRSAAVWHRDRRQGWREMFAVWGTDTTIEGRRNWDRGPTTLVAMSQNKVGELVIATREYGVLRYHAEKWERQNNSTPKDCFVYDFLFMNDGRSFYATSCGLWVSP